MTIESFLLGGKALRMSPLLVPPPFLTVFLLPLFLPECVISLMEKITYEESQITIDIPVRRQCSWQRRSMYALLKAYLPRETILKERLSEVKHIPDWRGERNKRKP